MKKQIPDDVYLFVSALFVMVLYMWVAQNWCYTQGDVWLLYITSGIIFVCSVAFGTIIK